MGDLIAFPSRRAHDPWVTKRQLAAYLGYSTRWIELRARDGLPSRMMGSRRRYRISEVERWMTQYTGEG